ncbi:MAG: RNA-binding cell elongation regulator Jag/EloR [Armatimonadota bacterium]|nr:RNA-binding cell elongation regulator Jag/EloR [Armatimonadota bacterium]MDR5696747.1 RNA-binding cell elongation regulator Jag/EloR [Armatimonadota bacterium]
MSRSEHRPGPNSAREVVATGRTVEEAIAAALERVGLTREDVEIHVLDEGSRGVFGLGGREARVRVAPKSALPEGEPADAATIAAAIEITRGLVQRMGFDATTTGHATERGLHLDVRGEGLAALIGRHGQGIEALETVVSLMLARSTGARTHVEVDVAGYRTRRRERVAEMARRAARRAVTEGTAVHLPPMDARDRRTVHSTLSEDVRVTTHSEGEGAARHVVIQPVPKRHPGQARRTDGTAGSKPSR